ncbi:MAG: YVTN family beta-propeller domain-containing protein [Acidobacteria bacterium]|nr:MAG: YVTN family beta-propeller domain-containing protein [Acidobacteriota bacterium]
MHAISRWINSLLVGLICSTALGNDLYQSAGEIPIGGEGGWDILTIDSAASRLYLSHATKVVVVDLRKNAVAGEIADTPGVHAFVPVPEVQRGFSSNGKESKSSVVDLTTLRTVSKIDTGQNPDAVVYEPGHGEVYIFNHSGNSVTVINAKATTLSATIQLDGHPEFAAVDEAAERVYCNIEDKSKIAVIDASKHQVVAYWSVVPGEEPSGIAFDARHHRLFAGCHNKIMVMLDTVTGRVIGNVPIGAGVDGCSFDDSNQLVFASCGDGTTTIAKEEAPDKLTIAQSLKTERGARTMALDPKSHRIYLPSAQFQPPPSPSPGASPARPTVVPNTLKLLVYGPAESVKH